MLASGDVTDPTFLELLGLCVLPGVLTPDECRALNTEALAGPVNPSTVYGADGDVLRDYRSSGEVVLDDGRAAGLRDRLEALAPRIAAHFSLDVTRCQPPQLLRYGPGDFFRRHVDRTRGDDVAPFVRERQLTLVVHVGEQDVDYEGGDLVLWGLYGPGSEDIPTPATLPAGTLVAFPSDVAHEVTDIVSGCRVTLVAWLA